MKKIILSVAAVLAFGVASAQSDTVKFGAKAGLNLSTITGDTNADSQASFYVGGFVDLPLAGKFHLQPELQYSMEGADNASLSYIKVPVMAKYYIIEGINVQAGPYVAFKAGGDTFVDDNTKSLDFGVAGGAAYDLPMGLFFDARYNVGVANISDIDGVDYMNATFQVGVGYKF